MRKACRTEHKSSSGNASCPGCRGGFSNAEFAQKTASDLSKKIKHLLWGAIIAVIVAIVKSGL